MKDLTCLNSHIPFILYLMQNALSLMEMKTTLEIKTKASGREKLMIKMKKNINL